MCNGICLESRGREGLGIGPSSRGGGVGVAQLVVCWFPQPLSCVMQDRRFHPLCASGREDFFPGVNMSSDSIMLHFFR